VEHRLQEIADRFDTSLDELLAFLDSPSGRRLRRMVATGLIVSVPLVMRIPGLRSTPIGRLIGMTGGAALVVKIAEAIRDWERSLPEQQVIEVPRVT
jgi:hypothetical protein